MTAILHRYHLRGGLGRTATAQATRAVESPARPRALDEHRQIGIGAEREAR